MRPTRQELHDFELLSTLWPGQWAPYVLSPEKADDIFLLPALRTINFTRRPVRFAGLREPSAVEVFEKWPVALEELHPYELLRLADRIGRLDGAKRAVDFMLEDVEGMEEKVCEMLRKGSGREVGLVGPRVVSKRAI